MGIEVLWDNEAKTVLRYQFAERWSWDEFFTAKKQAYNMIAAVSHKVGVIMDAPPNVQLPPNMLTHSLNALRNKHPNTLVVVFIMTRPFLRAMLNTMTKISRLAAANVELASTLDEARVIVNTRLRADHDQIRPTGS